MGARVVATYRVRSDAASIEARATAIAVEQSVEMPVPYIRDRRVLDEIVGRVEGIEERAPGEYDVRIGLAAETMEGDCAQTLNMIYGNSSMHDTVELAGVEFPQGFAEAFGGPRHGIAGWRRLAGAEKRALTCTALKPQGAPVAFLAKLARDFARGGMDFIKDDHGLANQHYSPFETRVRACAEAVRQANKETGGRTVYIPSLTGDLDSLKRQMAMVRGEGLPAVLIPPMVVGLPAFHALVRLFPDVLFMAHPSMTGGGRIEPALLMGRLFRLFGADATVFANHGGRFAYSTATCKHLARLAREDWPGIKTSIPVPAGGMTTERAPEMLDFYGRDTMLLIGGALMADLERIAETTAAFQRRVEQFAYT